MIAVYESTGDVPEDVAAVSPGAPAYLVIDSSRQGSESGAVARAEIEQEIRNSYKRGANIIFVGREKLGDGRIVCVGQKIDPLLANL